MKKTFEIIAAVLVLLVVAVLVAPLFAIDPIVKYTVEKVGPELTKTAIRIEKVHIAIFTGEAEINGLVIGNPEGFKTPEAISIGSLEISVDLKSIMTDRVMVRAVRVEGQAVTYEAGRHGSNIDRLLTNMEGVAAAESEDASAREGGKKVQINDLTIAGGKVNLSAGALGGQTVSLPLPKIHLKDIGDDDGSSLAEVVTHVMKAIVKAATRVVLTSGEAIGKGAKKVGGATLQGVGSVGYAATKGAGAIGGAAQKGLGGIVNGAQGLLGNGDEPPSPKE